MYEYIPIDYKNFKPTAGFQKQAVKEMAKVRISTPKSSTIKVSFEKRGEIYAGYAAVDTTQKTFVAYAVDKNIYCTLQMLAGQLSNQLNQRQGDFYEKIYSKSS